MCRGISEGIKMRSTEESRREHIQDYHKMLLFLNESTEDYCMLCGVFEEGELAGFLCVDNPDWVSDRMALLKKAGFLAEQMLFYKPEKR